MYNQADTILYNSQGVSIAPPTTIQSKPLPNNGVSSQPHPLISPSKPPQVSRHTPASVDHREPLPIVTKPASPEVSRRISRLFSALTPQMLAEMSEQHNDTIPVPPPLPIPTQSSIQTDSAFPSSIKSTPFQQTLPSSSSKGPLRRHSTLLGVQRMSENNGIKRNLTSAELTRPPIDLQRHHTSFDIQPQHPTTTQQTRIEQPNPQITINPPTQRTSTLLEIQQQPEVSRNPRIQRYSMTVAELKPKSAMKSNVGGGLQRNFTTNEMGYDTSNPKSQRYSMSAAEMQKNNPGLQRHVTFDNFILNTPRKQVNVQGNRYPFLTLACQGETGAHTFSETNSGRGIYSFGTDKAHAIWLADVSGKRVAGGEIRKNRVYLTLLSQRAGYRRGKYKKLFWSGVRKIEVEDQTYIYATKQNCAVWINKSNGETVAAIQNSEFNFFPNCPEIVEQAIALVQAYECNRKDTKKKKKKN